MRHVYIHTVIILLNRTSFYSGCRRQGQPLEQGEGQVGANPGWAGGLPGAWEETAV